MTGRSYIETPRGRVIQVQTSSGGVTAKLEWNPNFARRRSNTFNKAQYFVDNEVLRLSDQYIPFRTGMLKLSGKLGTIVGSGLVEYIAPHAKKQYYSNSGNGTQGTAGGGLRGAYWFQRMKNDNLQGIVQGAKNISGGR